MHADAIVARVVGSCLSGLHAKRIAACERAVASVVTGAALSLSAIALGMRAGTGYRHRVKAVDRLLGNAAVHGEREAIYRALAAQWLTGLPRIVVVVDWSDVSVDQRWHWLRAAVAVQGRSITLYEEVHPQRLLANRQVHERFLATLARLLPPGCKPIIMTDAGFRATWFKAVASRGWEFIGRIRGRALVRAPEQPWMRASDLYERAVERPCDLGLHDYARGNAVGVRLVLVKQRSRNRHRLNMYGKPRTGRTSTKCARRAREPWLLATSPGLGELPARAIVRLYAQRMGIEQAFRDTKNIRWGSGLHAARSRSKQRLQMLLLICHLASFVLRLIGEAAKARKMQFLFMNTRRTQRAEISALTLARRILTSSLPQAYLDRLTPWASLPPLRTQARTCAEQ